MTIALISHPECALHDPGIGHPERSERYQVIEAAFHTPSWQKLITPYTAPLIAKEGLYQTHDRAYIDQIFAIAPKTGMHRIDEDTFMNAHTLQAAQYAAGAVCLAVDLVMQGKAIVAFCNVRPPGHHAEYNRAMGFCFFNNVAVGVTYALQAYHLERIAIIDFDVHHGNGTQAIFQNNAHVLLCSSFEHPFYPGYDARQDNAHLLNLPLTAGLSGEAYRELVRTHWLSQIAAFNPQLIFFSAGFDAHEQDPLANIRLQQEDYVWLTQEIAQIARKHCEGKMISVLEGGYNLEVLQSCVPAHVKAMVGDSGFEPLTPTV